MKPWITWTDCIIIFEWIKAFLNATRVSLSIIKYLLTYYLIIKDLITFFTRRGLPHYIISWDYWLNLSWYNQESEWHLSNTILLKWLPKIAAIFVPLSCGKIVEEAELWIMSQINRKAISRLQRSQSCSERNSSWNKQGFH